ncbi:hypothetical protein NDU88_007536 [Pleurodeles waltl]|uniref:Uncharacterized protein n=1 Tax=Pleurodeles waltl TaxID=8319 RepID=A0AAV7N2B4_PLEWA|nr:hypothetical protein NDU88_007536 [Pleurodeles waltl]
MQTALCYKEAPEGARIGSVWALIGIFRSTLNLVWSGAKRWHKIIRRIGGLFGAWPWFSEAEMAPKSAWNIGDKTEGACQMRVAKDGSDGHLAGKRPTGGPTKLSSKAAGGTVKDVKDLPRQVQSETKAKDRSQPVITNVLTNGGHENDIGNPMLLSKDTPTSMGEDIEKIKYKEELLRAKSRPTESNLDTDTSQACWGKGKEFNLAADDAVKDLEFETRKFERVGKFIDWTKDGGDKFYSLTHDSEAVSSGYNLSEEEGSISLEAESLSSVAGPTVKLQQRHRKHIRPRTGGVDSPGRSAAMFKWDYSGIGLTSMEKESRGSKDVLPPNAGVGEGCLSESINNLDSTDTKMLQLIDGTVRELQTETRAESQDDYQAIAGHSAKSC